MDQIENEILRYEKTVQVTLEIAASKAKVAVRMRHDPLAILCWAFAAKEAGHSAAKLANPNGIKPADSANSDVNETVWKQMKTILCTSTALTPNEVERLGLHLLTDTQVGDRVPELRELHERALDKLKNHLHLIADKMIETLRDARYQLVASDFLAQEREEFMRQQSEVMQQQEEVRQKASAAAGDAIVSALEIKRQIDMTALVSNLVDKRMLEIKPKKKPDIVVISPFAGHAPVDIRRAKTRTAMQEVGGNVKEAHKLLDRNGDGIALSTMYGHLKFLDANEPGWNIGEISKQHGNLENGVSPRTKGKQRGS